MAMTKSIKRAAFGAMLIATLAGAQPSYAENIQGQDQVQDQIQGQDQAQDQSQIQGQDQFQDQIQGQDQNQTANANNHNSINASNNYKERAVKAILNSTNAPGLTSAVDGCAFVESKSISVWIAALGTADATVLWDYCALLQGKENARSMDQREKAHGHTLLGLLYANNKVPEYKDSWNNVSCNNFKHGSKQDFLTYMQPCTPEAKGAAANAGAAPVVVTRDLIRN